MDDKTRNGILIASLIGGGVLLVWFLVTLLGSDSAIQAQALANLIGAGLGTVGAFGIAFWSLGAQQRRERDRETTVARAFLAEINNQGNIDLNILKLSSNAVFRGQDDEVNISLNWNFLDINDLTPGQDFALAGIAPHVSIQFSILIAARRRANQIRAGGQIDHRVAEWNASDHLLSITIAWIGLLEAVEKILDPDGQLKPNVLAQFRTLADRLLPYAKVLRAQIDFARVEVPLPTPPSAQA